MISATFHIMSLSGASCRTWPLTLSQMRPPGACPERGLMAEIGADRSNALAASHGWALAFAANCRSRRVKSTPTP